MGLNPRGDDVEKTMTVGSVHVPTALGNLPKNGSLDGRKRRTFKEAISVAYTQEDTEKRFDVDIRKTDSDKMQIFGWASVSTVNGALVVDKQGDIIPVDEIEKAAYDFVQFSRDMGDMHSRMGTGRMIESVVCTKEKAACGLKAVNDKGEPVEGWWVGFQVADPECWRALKSGAQPELSIGGRASWTDDAAA